jgi:hypothetical protein
MLAFTFWLLSTYNYAANTLGATKKFATKLLNALYTLFNPETYIFFDRVSHAYPALKVNPYASTSAIPMWTYNSDTHEFFEWPMVASSQAGDQLPLLSMEIVEDGNIAYDLTDFIETIRVYNACGEVCAPYICHIIGAWTLSSGIVLDPYKNFTVHLITNDGDSQRVNLNDMIVSYTEQEEDEQEEDEQEEDEQEEDEQEEDEQEETIESSTNIDKLD